MNHIRIALTLIGLVMVLRLTPDAVAAKCRGEASFAIAECACTVRNRIDAGWSPARVLSAYYAPSVRATPPQIQTVSDIMNRKSTCQNGLYFMYSRADAIHLGIERIEPVLVVRQGNKEIRFFERDFRRRNR